MAKIKKINYIYAVGRRKTATARVRLFKGKGESTVNGIPMEKYFGFGGSLWGRPFGILDISEKYFVTARATGGGKMGQLDAVVCGIARALSKESREKFRGPLKKAGLLTRDPRKRQRRMVGMGGKSRRKKQSPKR
jgi:small subunit ribosomal protein S9